MERCASLAVRLLAGVSVAVCAATAGAQRDLAGLWGQRFHEDLPERGAGPEIGDYTGLPINDATRLRADSWDAAKWTMPERQCEPHPADYGPRGPASLRISSTVDPISQDVISWNITVMWGLPHRTIYMDGRPRPTEGWLRRNGLARSDKATLVEYFIRNENYLTLVTVVMDPVYLTEPLVRTSDWVLDPGLQLSPFSCIPAIEIERPRGTVPHHLPGTNAFLDEYPTRYGLPAEAARGGAATMYPDYLPRLSGGQRAAR
jgi:hypothetical protein